jgi:hypothetical protein
MRASDTLLAVGFTLGAIATSGCSPNPPTDGFFGCASAGSRCPAAFPYCDPTDHRCYATAPVDSGPRPDTGPVPDTGPGAREYQSCGSPANCGTLACIGGACMTPCAIGSGTCADRMCVPVSMMDPATACVPSCNSAMPDCSAFPNTRARIVMGSVCQCVPSSWP